MFYENTKIKQRDVLHYKKYRVHIQNGSKLNIVGSRCTTGITFLNIWL